MVDWTLRLIAVALVACVLTFDTEWLRILLSCFAVLLVLWPENGKKE